MMMISKNKTVWHAIMNIIRYGDRSWNPSLQFVTHFLMTCQFWTSNIVSHSNDSIKIDLSVFTFSIFGGGHYYDTWPFEVDKELHRIHDVLGLFISFCCKDLMIEMFSMISDSPEQTAYYIYKWFVEVYKSPILRAWFYLNNANWVFKQDSIDKRISDACLRRNKSRSEQIKSIVQELSDFPIDFNNWHSFSYYASNPSIRWERKYDHGQVALESIKEDLNDLFGMGVVLAPTPHDHFYQHIDPKKYWAHIKTGHYYQIGSD